MVNKNEFQKEIRYEKKWVYKNYHFHQLLTKLQRSELRFKIHHSNRVVNSIYYDDKNLSNVKDNLEGEKRRTKFRVRWYGSEKLIYKPILEIKYKDALKTHKIRKIIKLDKKLKIDNFSNLDILKKNVNSKRFNKNILYPKIHISYKRTYLISSNNLIRATIDENIKYKKLDKFNQNFYKNFNNIILEMKYDINLDQYFRSKLNQVFTRYSKNSKYVNCMIFSTRNFTT
tara:strand:- start:235 stop:921 length:687 start_codon:yes stop_codon:yes gene_type:complete